MTDLNDFFAKRDKKKSKGIAKFSSINEIERKLLKMDKKREMEKKYSDEEWNEFEEKSKDYSGLKIQNTISENDESDLNELGNLFDEKVTPLCPWKVIEKVENENKTCEQLESKPTPENNVYIPPHLRKKPTKSTRTESELSKDLQNNESKSLKINNKEMFPVLSATSANMLGSKRKQEQGTLS